MLKMSVNDIARYLIKSFLILNIYQIAKAKIQNLKYTIVFFKEIIGSIDNTETINSRRKKIPNIFEKIF